MMLAMRTTLTIDADVERLLRNEMRRTNKSMKAVVNDALRVGLGTIGKPVRPARFKVKPHAFGFKPSVDVDRLNQLVGEMEASEAAMCAAPARACGPGSTGRRRSWSIPATVMPTSCSIFSSRRDQAAT